MPTSPEIYKDIGLKKERNRPRKLMLGVLAVASFLGLAGDIQIPEITEMHHSSSRPSIDDDMSVMTANVHSWKTVNGKNNFDIFMNILKKEDPDIACLQEVLADGTELQKIYQEGYNVLFATTIWYPFKGRFGNAVISQSPIEISDVVGLPHPSTVTPRNAISFKIETADGPIDMLNVHLSINAEESAGQLRHLKSRENKVEMMCGDFNQQPKTVIAGPFGKLASPGMLRDNVLTFPSQDPSREIDYILPGCGVLDNSETKTIYIGSDHLARIEHIYISGCEN